MQGTHRKLLDLANSVGISDRVLKLADRRNKGDAMLVYGGMVSFCSVRSRAASK